MMPTPFTSQAATREPAAATLAASRLPALLRAAALVSLLAQVTAGREAHADPRPIAGSSLAGKKVLAPKAGKLKKAGSKPVAGELVKRSVTVDSSIRGGRNSFDWDKIRTEGYMEGDELLFLRQTSSKDIEPILSQEGQSLRSALREAQVFNKPGREASEIKLSPQDDRILTWSDSTAVMREFEKRYSAERYEVLQNPIRWGRRYIQVGHDIYEQRQSISVFRNKTIPVSIRDADGDGWTQTTHSDEWLQRNLALPDPIPAAGRVKVFRGNKKIGDYALPFDRLRARATTDRMVGDDWVNTNNLYVSPVYENDDGEGEAVLLGLAAFPLGIELHVVDLTAVKEGRAKPLSWKVKASTTSGSVRVVLTGAEPGREYGIVERVGDQAIMSGRTLATIRLPEPDHPLVKKHGMSYLPAKEFATPPPAQ